jgi:hypothetical protein
MTFSAAAAVSSAAISESILSIQDSVLSRLAAAASAEVSASAMASALAMGVILDAEASGGVRWMACMTLQFFVFSDPQSSPLQLRVGPSSVKVMSVLV